MTTKHQVHLIHQKYRPDIDGLRAIAILAVVIFHAAPTKLSGGFIGVDIFFVISGYLISTIIYSSLEHDRFSILEFYVRRVRRIFPSLLLVMTAVLAFGWISLFADEYELLGKHTSGGAGFISNLMLWGESGYFDKETELKPLLHLWSLGIEEQFYLLWPLLLVFFRQRKSSFLWVTVAIAVVSFAINIYWVSDHSESAFYLPVSRFWELMVGGVLAYLVLHWPQRVVRHAHIQSFLGLILLLVGLVALNKFLAFPGWWALLPTLGTFLLISAGPDTWINKKILSNKLMVGIGLISYPLYLWHWPLLSFANVIEGKMYPRELKFGLVVAAFVLAWLTYRFVERPFRNNQHNHQKALALTLVMVVMGAVGWGIHSSGGAPSRSVASKYDDDYLKAIFSYQNHWDGWSECDYVTTTGQGDCQVMDATSPIDLLVIGDSHAGHLASGVKSLLEDKGLNAAVILRVGCYPVYPRQDGDGKKVFVTPDDFNTRALDYAVQSKDARAVLLSGYSYLQTYDNRFGEYQFRSDQDVAKYMRLLGEALHETFDRLLASGKKVVFVLDTPELLESPQGGLDRGVLRRGKNIDLPRKKFDGRSALYRKMIEGVMSAYRQVTFIDPSRTLCDDQWCYGRDGDAFLYGSKDHLSPYGSRKLIQDNATAILGALKQP